MTTTFSTAAREAIIGVGTNRQGATVPWITPLEVVVELQRAGVVGDGRGLTRRGSIIRLRLVDEAMESAFGC